MSDTPAPEQATVVFRTGHRLEFSFFAFRQVAGGYEFIDYPGERGYKTVRLIRADAIASIAVTARETELDSFSLAAPVVAATPTVAGYQDGDPQHAQKPTGGPVSYVARDPHGMLRDPLANPARYAPTPQNPLRTEIIGENGAPETVNAAMV